MDQETLTDDTDSQSADDVEGVLDNFENNELKLLTVPERRLPPETKSENVLKAMFGHCIFNTNTLNVWIYW